MTGDLTLPEFLKIPADVRARAWEGRVLSDPNRISIEVPRSDADAARAAEVLAAYSAERKQRASVAARNWAATVGPRARGRQAEARAAVLRHDGQVYLASFDMWVPMPPARRARIEAELPTDAHRAAFLELLSAGPDRPLARPASAAPAPGKAKKAARPAADKPAAPRRAKDENYAKVAAMLARPEGATLAEIAEATGWLKHSASAYLTALRKTRGISSDATDKVRGRTYKFEENAS